MDYDNKRFLRLTIVFFVTLAHSCSLMINGADTMQLPNESGSLNHKQSFYTKHKNKILAAGAIATSAIVLALIARYVGGNKLPELSPLIAPQSPENQSQNPQPEHESLHAAPKKQESEAQKPDVAQLPDCHPSHTPCQMGVVIGAAGPDVNKNEPEDTNFDQEPEQQHSLAIENKEQTSSENHEQEPIKRKEDTGGMQEPKEGEKLTWPALNPDQQRWLENEEQEIRKLQNWERSYNSDIQHLKNSSNEDQQQNCPGTMSVQQQIEYYEKQAKKIQEELNQRRPRARQFGLMLIS